MMQDSKDVRNRTAPGGVAARVLFVAALSATALGCQNANDVAKRLGEPSKSAVEARIMQSREIEASDQVAVLAAVTQTLQDLGFTVQESSAEAGVVTGAKQRDAEEAGQIAGQVALTVALAMLGAIHTPVWDKSQSIHVTSVVAPTRATGRFSVRVSFDRYLTNNHGVQWRAELIEDAAIYREFFERLGAGTALSVGSL